MTLEERTEWTEALKSDKYKQGNGYLNQSTGTETTSFCCLGVFCDLIKDRLHLTVVTDVVGLTSYNDDSTGFCKTLRDRYDADSFGFRVPANLLTAEELKNQCVPKPIHKDVNIADLNDAGMKFLRIAELIGQCVEVV